MSLPKLEVPKYKMSLLSGEEITYRPFLVKEQKILLTSLQTGERQDALQAMIDVVKACTFDKVDSKQPTYEVERVFLFIRAKSVGEELPINVKCEECEKINPYNVQLIEHMKVTNNKKVEPVMLTETYGLVFSYPSMEQMKSLADIPTDDSMVFYMRLASLCMRGIIDGTEFVVTTDSTPAEKAEIMDTWGPLEFQKVQAFFDSLPAISYDIDFDCKECKHHNHLTVEGTDSFFG